MRACVYAGSFDPFHFGHLRIVQRACNTFDEVYVLVARNPKKKYLLDWPQRMEIIRSMVPGKVVVDTLPDHTLLSDWARSRGVTHIVKGLRNISDMEYEKMLHEVTVALEQGVDTVLYFSAPEDAKLSSSAVKELVSYNADVHNYVNLRAKAAVELTQNEQIIIGVTGVIGAGKSTVVKQLTDPDTGECAIFDHRGASIVPDQLHHIDVDVIVHNLTYNPAPFWTTPETTQLRENFRDLIKVPLRITAEDGKSMPNMQAVGRVLFTNAEVNQKARELYKPVLTRYIRQAMAGKHGIILINGALLIDMQMTELCNNYMFVVQAPDETLHRRLMERYLDAEEVKIRQRAQLSHAEKIAKLVSIMSQDNSFGTYRPIINDDCDPEKFRFYQNEIRNIFFHEITNYVKKLRG